MHRLIQQKQCKTNFTRIANIFSSFQRYSAQQRKSPVFLLKCCTSVSHHGHVYTKRLSDLFNIFVISIAVIY